MLEISSKITKVILPTGPFKIVINMSKSVFCLDILSDQNQKCSDKCQYWLENVRCPTTISNTADT